MLAKIVNDNAGILEERGAVEFFASKLAPTVDMSAGYHTWD
ncbi:MULTISPECIES: hypothetical protein [unclassified Pseudomonas]|nr:MULTISPECIES: hypothetical protein [unclassified Pseudomonas]